MAVHKKILLLNPSIGSLNLGDHIIFQGAYNQIENLLKDSFIVEISTHSPIAKYLKCIKEFDLRFVCGSNLLRGKMNGIFRQWDINLLTTRYLDKCILLGVGWWQYNDNPNLYTKILYRRALSSDLLHSVRDSYTECQMKKMGFENVINTGCPTMWNLTHEHCATIPNKKAKSVVCTITDYKINKKLDKQMINILNKNYESVYFWPQGVNDLKYYKEICGGYENIQILPPTLKAFDKILEQDVDYVGTRLHGGIRALQKKRRTIIVAVDNRAIEKKKDFNLECVMREEIENLSKMVNETFQTQINIPIENIKKWKDQFLIS